MLRAVGLKRSPCLRHLCSFSAGDEHRICLIGEVQDMVVEICSDARSREAVPGGAIGDDWLCVWLLGSTGRVHSRPRFGLGSAHLRHER